MTSEKSESEKESEKALGKALGKKHKKKVQLPSERYTDAQVVEKKIDFDKTPKL